MNYKEILIGSMVGIVSGAFIRTTTKSHSLLKVKCERKIADFYKDGKKHYELLQSSKERLQKEAQQNINREENEIDTTNNTTNSKK